MSDATPQRAATLKEVIAAHVSESYCPSGFADGACPQTVHEVSTLLNTSVPIIERWSADGMCFVWQGCVDAQGYPDRGRRKHDRAHRQLWDIVRGERPAGFTIHHLCEEKRCLNLEHMVLISRADHIRLHMGEAKRLGRSVDTA